MVYKYTARCPQSGKSLRALPTTLLEKSFRGTRLIAGHNGNNGKDWVIRDLTPKPVMIGYGVVSTTTKASVLNDGLINQRVLEV